MNIEDLFALAADLLAKMEEQGSEALSDEQHTLLAYCYLDSQVQEGGFVQLIASGYGAYVLENPVADSLRRWKIKLTPRVLDKARALYAKFGAQIEARADEGADVDDLRREFADFEELDAEYYDCADDDLAAVCAFVAENRARFV
ncbi:DMP19 family protein [Neisseriaceae bacterium B1]